MSIAIQLNGVAAEIADAATIADLLRTQGLDPAVRGIAVALNESIVPHGRWSGTPISPGDRVEIVKAFAGG
jgi:sulfur carrier protein